MCRTDCVAHSRVALARALAVGPARPEEVPGGVALGAVVAAAEALH